MASISIQAERHISQFAAVARQMEIYFWRVSGTAVPRMLRYALLWGGYLHSEEFLKESGAITTYKAWAGRPGSIGHVGRVSVVRDPSCLISR
jgi:hypothetical protein